MLSTKEKQPLETRCSARGAPFAASPKTGALFLPSFELPKGKKRSRGLQSSKLSPEQTWEALTPANTPHSAWEDDGPCSPSPWGGRTHHLRQGQPWRISPRPQTRGGMNELPRLTASGEDQRSPRGSKDCPVSTAPPPGRNGSLRYPSDPAAEPRSIPHRNSRSSDASATHSKVCSEVQIFIVRAAVLPPNPLRRRFLRQPAETDQELAAR